MGGITITDTTRIIPPTESGAAGMVSGLTLDLTVFILGSIFMLMAGYLIFLMIFGQPIKIAKDANNGGCIIQHTNTPKSGIMKTARVGGEGFQYKDVRDGTVAATPNSVFNLLGRQLVFTFSDFGVTISLKHLAGVSVLVHNGITGFAALKAKYYSPITILQKFIHPDTDEEVLVAPGDPEEGLNSEKDEVLLQGYDFPDFKKVLKQSKEEHVVPLTIESVPDFTDRNISAVTTEKKMTVLRHIQSGMLRSSNPALQIAGIAFAISLILLMSTVIK